MSGMSIPKRMGRQVSLGGPDAIKITPHLSHHATLVTHLVRLCGQLTFFDNNMTYTVKITLEDSIPSSGMVIFFSPKRSHSTSFTFLLIDIFNLFNSARSIKVKRMLARGHGLLIATF
jgi:hypothetical protein